MSKLQCPHCAAPEGRCRYTLSFADRVYRRRKCPVCSKTYTTIEVLTPEGVKHPNPSDAYKQPLHDPETVENVAKSLDSGPSVQAA